MNIQPFEATITVVGSSQGIVVPSHIRKVFGVQRGKTYRFYMEEIPAASINDESEGISTVSYAFALPWVVA